MTGEEGR